MRFWCRGGKCSGSVFRAQYSVFREGMALQEAVLCGAKAVCAEKSRPLLQQEARPTTGIKYAGDLNIY